MRLYLRVVLTAFLLPVLFLSFIPSAEASIVIVVTDDGTDLMFNMKGTMDLTGTTAQHTFAISEDLGAFNQLYSLEGPFHRRLGLGSYSIGVPGGD